MSSRREEVDVIIVGAGPAGLAAANSSVHEGLRIAVLDSGNPIDERSVSHPDQILNGVGGAGLLSDGKLSFFPSSHTLWALPSHQILRDGYIWLTSLIDDFFPSVPPFPDAVLPNQWCQPHSTNQFICKHYSSLVLTPSQRLTLLRRLVVPISNHILPRHEVIAISRASSQLLFKIRQSDGSEKEMIASQAMFCGGRLSPLFLKKICPELEMRYRRFEYGIRIEQPAGTFCLKEAKEADPKFIMNDKTDGVQWRTFCCCRQGSVLLTEWHGIHLCSGISAQSSSVSNVGFNCRIESRTLFHDLKEEIDKLLTGNIKHFSINIEDFLTSKDPAKLYGPKLDELLRKGLHRFAKQFNLQGARIHGPVLEGVGYYPALTSQLESSLTGLYVSGDASGIFRGLLAAFLSGYYVARLASRRRVIDSKNISSAVRIKRSSIDTMPLVFTAQSKKYFYCRDAICEFVLKRNRLPINPFRIFGYFLGDRVDREIIRQGNNQLIRTCDEVWVFGPIADGVLFELIYAAHLQKPVRFFTVATKASEIRPIYNLDNIVFEPEIHASRQTRESLLRELKLLVDASLTQTERTLFDLI